VVFGVLICVFFVIVCSAKSIPALFTNQEKQILFVVFTATQLPHCETILSTKCFYFLHNDNGNFQLCLQQRSEFIYWHFFNKTQHWPTQWRKRKASVTWHCQYPLGSMWMLVLSAFSSGIRRLGFEAEHSPTFNSKFKNAWSYTSNPLMP
jgi:hypothetical protein